MLIISDSARPLVDENGAPVGDDDEEEDHDEVLDRYHRWQFTLPELLLKWCGVDMLDEIAAKQHEVWVSLQVHNVYMVLKFLLA
jgi:hypothetical protein